MQFLYKIKIIYPVYCICAALFFTSAPAQLKTVNKSKIYRQQVQADSLQKMVELKSMIPGIVYDLKYATKNNFTGQKLYVTGATTFLRMAAAKALQKVQIELAKQGYSLKIFDAYRPYGVTKKMWDLVHDERYVADPSKGSNHNRGLAADLTLVRLKDGSELNMGTGFDHFTDTAHHGFTNLPEEVLKNRALLRKIMEGAGFKALETEWWHYNWPNDRNYEVLNIDFKKLKHH